MRFGTFPLVFSELVSCFLVSAAAPEARASVRMTCYFEVKVVKPRKADRRFNKTSRAISFKILRLSKRAESLGRHHCSYYVKRRLETRKADVMSSDKAALGRLKAGTVVTLRHESASWILGFGSNRRAGGYSRWYLYIPPKKKPRP